ncbi:hypothetical protein SPI_04934 [Niveomyces insectorum RCEF 264]|uniref:Uncharacterized protein n=1 Tax=Niveomyces insectorum RCEF 264 TaxID=1081102 RepID=A0A167TSU9_9HYPO|nr:hypothetical protein SPI_04934 [Niveomyces insectorum RCEF 264]
MAATFNDIRVACQSAQNRIMRLQQTTNNQVGLTSSIREKWFEELRHIAQCFITAQQSSARIEQAVNTERAQLQGALSSALNERDLRVSERNAAAQEVRFLRSRLEELTNKTDEQKQNCDTQNRLPSVTFNGGAKSKGGGGGDSREGFEHRNFGPHSKSNSWVLTENGGSTSSHGDGSEADDFADSVSFDLRDLPTTLANMPYSPGATHGVTANFKSGFEVHRPDTTDSFNDDRQRQSATPQFASQPYPPQSSHSKFFNRDGRSGSRRQQSHRGGHLSNDLRIPDFNGRSRSRFNATPARAPQGAPQGPFAPPPPPPQPHQRPPSAFQGFHGSKSPFPLAIQPPATTADTWPCPLPAKQQKTAPFPPPQQFQRTLQIMPPPAGPSALASAPPQPSPLPSSPAPGPVLALGPSLCTDLALVRDNSGHYAAAFASGVAESEPSGKDELCVQDIFQFFNIIKDWVCRYCRVPNSDVMQNLNQNYPRLWDYACSVTYPSNRSNASSHSLYMLCNEPFRAYFITRMLVQYVVQQTWSPHSWDDLDDDLTDTLNGIKHRLDQTYGYDAVLQPHERHALVEKRAHTVMEFLRQPAWQTCKAQKVALTLARFKDIVGPMVTADAADYDTAMQQLTHLCEDAVRLSAVLITSRLSFQFIFNECGIKFSDQSHRPLNTALPARELQAHHWRLMCVITPGITYRNDAGVNVDPRFMAKANVLLMQ